MPQTKKERREKRRAREKAKRELYLTLMNEIGAGLCMICKYSEQENLGCCEGFSYCAHPSESICEIHDEGLDFDMDCWAFKNAFPLDTVVELASAVISNDFTEWGFMPYSKTEITLFGYYDNCGIEEGRKYGKVRIGHTGKPEQTESENNNESN